MYKRKPIVTFSNIFYLDFPKDFHQFLRLSCLYISYLKYICRYIYKNTFISTYKYVYKKQIYKYIYKKHIHTYIKYIYKYIYMKGVQRTSCQQLEHESPLLPQPSNTQGKSWPYNYHFCSLSFADSQLETAVIRV